MAWTLPTSIPPEDVMVKILSHYWLANFPSLNPSHNISVIPLSIITLVTITLLIILISLIIFNFK